ncbi:MAG: saccharopine dehydrogenase C-terminal domain-containing protein [Chitinophagaceae bacterium]
MKQILLFGAGKSSTCLIDYLIAHAAAEDWHITIADIDTAIIRTKTGDAASTTAIATDIHDIAKREALIGEADIVISLMPPALHFLIAQSCLLLGKSLLTASYVDDQLKELAASIEDNGLLFLCEMGLDPGIDHMSAMKIIHNIKNKGGTITSFKSHCGGLVAPESDDNPWHYKISWNPRNVVMAGSSGAIYRVWEEEARVEYEEIFKDCDEIEVEGFGLLAWYPNRDSLDYIAVYELEETATFIRTTLRHPAFCRAWAVLVALQMTAADDGDMIKYCHTLSNWFHAKLHALHGEEMGWRGYLQKNIEEHYQEEITNMLDCLGLFTDEPLPDKQDSSATVLQQLLESKLALQPNDKDIIVMVHEIDYSLNEQEIAVVSTLVVKGENSLRTAMAKTVGLPLGIATKLILNGGLRLTGLHIPNIEAIYEPVLQELEEYGIRFTETERAFL